MSDGLQADDLQGGVDRLVDRCADWPALPDPRFLPFLRHWAERRRGLMMRRQDIDPLALKRCLPNVWLHRYRPESGDFVCLLAGEQVNAAWGGSIAGRPLSEIVPPQHYPQVLHRYRRVIGLPAVQMLCRTIQPAGLAAKVTERVIVPVSDAEGRPVAVFGMTLYHFDPLAGSDLPVGQEGEGLLYLCQGLPDGAP